MQQIVVTRDFDAPLERVWGRYTDHRGWSRWAGLGRVTLAREGRLEPDGAGCVRVIGPGPFAVHEEVLEFEPPHRMVYALTKGLVPIRNHRGEVVFAPLPAGGTRVVWRCRFDSAIPLLGGLLQAGIGRMFAQVLARLDAQLS